MTANNSVRTATAIADPNEPANTLSPSWNNAVVVGLTQTQAFVPPFKALYIGSAGNIKIDVAGSGTGLTFINVAKGTWLAVRTSKIYTTGTTATHVIGVF